MTNQAPAPPDPNTASAEPLISVATVTAAATALVGLMVAFGLDLTADQRTAILGLVAVVAPIVVAAWGRRKVYSPASVAKLLAARRR